MARKNNWPSAVELSDTTPAEVGEMISFHRQIMELPKVNLKSPQELRERIQWYLDICQAQGRRPFVEGLAAALKTNRMTLWNIANENTERGEVIRGTKHLILSLLESWGIEGKLNPVSVIFYQKNLGEYRDVSDIAVEARQQPTVAVMTPEEIQRALDEDIPIDPEPAVLTDNVL